MIASCEASSKHQPVALATNFKMRFSQTSVCVQFDPEIPKTVAISCRSNAASCHFCLPVTKRDRQWEEPGRQPLRTGARNGHSSATASATRPPGSAASHENSPNHPKKSYENDSGCRGGEALGREVRAILPRLIRPSWIAWCTQN